MNEPTLPQLIEKFNIISKSLSSGQFEYPQLEIKMRMNWDEPESVFYASLEHVEVKDGCILKGTYGNGSTPEEAMRDYYKRVVGKQLVFHAMSPKYRRECVVV
jgi:hypothetical protein